MRSQQVGIDVGRRSAEVRVAGVVAETTGPFGITGNSGDGGPRTIADPCQTAGGRPPPRGSPAPPPWLGRYRLYEPKSYSSSGTASPEPWPKAYVSASW